MGSLTEVQKSIIIGCLLGDGYMHCKTNAYLQITHSLKQKELVDWKYEKLKNLVNTMPSYYFNNGRHCYRFLTRSLPDITSFYQKFYRNDKKIIPKGVKIDGLTLAVWFMDDGSRSRSSVYLNTQQFSRNNQMILRKILKKECGIKSTLNIDKKYFRLRIRVESIFKLKKLIEPFLIPSFKYKLPHNPVTTDVRRNAGLR